MTKRLTFGAPGLRKLVVGLALSLVCASIAFASPFEEATSSRAGGGGGALGGTGSSGGGSQNACGALLCLAGVMMTGQNPSSCSGYITSYFTIVKFKNGVFSPSKTMSARANFLNQCSGGDSQTKGQVNNQFGGLLGL